MPSVNIYTSRERVEPLKIILPELRGFIAKKLSCGDRRLASDEMSLRILVPKEFLSIAETEIEIKAYDYRERVERQDDICLAIKGYVEETCPRMGSVYVWLQLSELGHSAKE